MVNVVITGANRGIGLELVRCFAKKGKVYGLCRKASEALISTENVTIVEGVDLKSEAAIHKAMQKCPDRIDILICCAGIFQRSGSAVNEVTADSVQEQFLVNAVAPLMVVQSALAKLGKGAKVALISSRMGSIGDNSSGGYYGYRMSKAALNAMGASLAIDFKTREVAVGVFHPGFVQTEMTGGAGQYKPHESAEMLEKRIDDLTLSTSGEFRHAQGDLLPW